jgi:hypothetical protein
VRCPEVFTILYTEDARFKGDFPAKVVSLTRPIGIRRTLAARLGEAEDEHFYL